MTNHSFHQVINKQAIYVTKYQTPFKSFPVISACRETAFAYAITAAGVSYALTRACSDGSLKGCQCVSTNRHKLTTEGWEYEGCHDNVEFGYRVGKKFVDSRERGRDFRATVNLHNNEAGRMVS